MSASPVDEPLERTFAEQKQPQVMVICKCIRAGKEVRPAYQSRLRDSMLPPNRCAAVLEHGAPEVNRVGIGLGGKPFKNRQ